MHDQTLVERGDDARFLDRCFAQWVCRRSGSEALARAAFALSRAEGEGHACVRLDEAGLDADEMAVLRAHAWVGDGAAVSPFVLDAAGRFYAWRTWRHEALLADEIRRRARARAGSLSNAHVVADVNELFAGQDERATQWQRAAVAAAPDAGVFVLTGGPGTGKTATALRLLLVLMRRAEALGLPAEPSIALAAPTGKAAQRLAHSLATGRRQLLSTLGEDSAFRPLLERLASARTSTLHRLLGYRPRENTFSRSASDPLAADIVLVDEASMADLALMRTLVVALRPEALLILIGDPGQLAAVEAGSVLSDIVACAPENAFPVDLATRISAASGLAPQTSNAPLAGRVVTLRHGWRAGDGLQRSLEGLRSGDPVWLDRFCADKTCGDVALYTCADGEAVRARVAAWLDAHADVYRGQQGLDPAVALARLRRTQILCALREGPFGTVGINAAIERELGARGRLDPGQAWYHGRPVLIVRNDYARELYNGDIGVALDDGDGLRVWFEAPERDGGSAWRSFSPRALPQHETAWAITIHRSQGSEYGDVAVVLPPDPSHRILSRELLYTAISRATHSAQIWGSAASVRAAAMRPVRRMGGLRDRLR